MGHALGTSRDEEYARTMPRLAAKAAEHRFVGADQRRQLNDLSRSLIALEQDATLIAVIGMGQSSWLVAGIVPGIDRQPLKKLAPDCCLLNSATRGSPSSWRQSPAGSS